MKTIYTKVVIEMVSGRVVEQESYHYHGPVAHVKGTPDVPPKSAAELEIEKLNLQSFGGRQTGRGS
ncbi:hypothetical protein LCGC14_1733050 [marine sediment metagenome]|uniref:Uncharacterized protein n=1 Tax=marine sediment metagenome TaxID=412755 RepID=A0A0F9H8S1_9ZZZZ